MTDGESRYTCDHCRASRIVKFDTVNRLFDARNANGLSLYSDIHRCVDGMLGINNLQIDDEYAVRSFDRLKLPSEKKLVKPGIGPPMPKVIADGIPQLRITESSRTGGFRMTIEDKGLDIFLIIGDVRPEEENYVLTITSVNGSITLNLYESIEITPHLPDWLHALVDTLEELPPTKLGLFVDTLRYIRKLEKVPSANFHKTILRTILQSHKISFSILPDKYSIELDKKQDLLGHDTIVQMASLLEYIKRQPETTLLQFSGIYDQELYDLIYLFLLLQQENFLFINYADQTASAN